MDRREGVSESGFKKDLEQQDDYNDKIMEDGKPIRVPYGMIKEVTFSDISQTELRDIEHSARLQYRLLLMDPILKAKIEFHKKRIIITYNPTGSENRKEKINQQELLEFLEKEGVHVKKDAISERDVDYYNEIYKYQFDPVSIREHAPYGYSREEWKKMKPEYTIAAAKNLQDKQDKFHTWQDSYLQEHPELWKEYNYTPQEKKPTLMEKIFGKKKREKEKGFWFHGT